MPEIMQSALGSVAVPMLFFLQEVEIKLFYVNTLTGGCRVRLKKMLDGYFAFIQTIPAIFK